jgi:hypothetical protein
MPFLHEKSWMPRKQDNTMALPIGFSESVAFFNL